MSATASMPAGGIYYCRAWLAEPLCPRAREVPASKPFISFSLPSATVLPGDYCYDALAGGGGSGSGGSAPAFLAASTMDFAVGCSLLFSAAAAKG